MEREQIIRMAREAGMTIVDNAEISSGIQINRCSYFDIKRFAALVAAAEREACAQFLESTQLGSLPNDTALHYARLLKGFAEGIRARGQA